MEPEPDPELQRDAAPAPNLLFVMSEPLNLVASSRRKQNFVAKVSRNFAKFHKFCYTKFREMK
jgi:hypothetical protein